MALYSEKVMDHFRNPRNVGVIEDANGIGEVGNAKCGDIMKMYLKIEDGIVHLAGFSPFYDPHETIFYFILGDFKERSKLSPGDHVEFSASAYHGTDSSELIYGKDLKTFRVLSESEVKKLYR